MAQLPMLVLAAGITLLLMLLFQLSTGMRWIKLGRHHFTIHKWWGWSMLALALAHATAAYLTFFVGL